MATIRLTSAWLFVTLCTCFAAQSQALLDGKVETSYVDAKNCGTTNDLANRIEVCAKPWMDMIQGTVEKWPSNTNDVKDLCASFGGCERCIRENGKKCAHGFHKTIIGTVGTSIQRARRRECQESNLVNILKATQCFEKNQKIVHPMISNITSHFGVIEKDIKDLDQKTNALCCMVNDLEGNVKRSLGNICPNDVKLITRVLKGVLQEALDLICRTSKCQNVFKGYKVVTVNTDRFSGMIATLLNIVFTLA